MPCRYDEQSDRDDGEERKATEAGNDVAAVEEVGVSDVVQQMWNSVDQRGHGSSDDGDV